MSKEKQYNTFCWKEYEQSLPRRFFKFWEKEEFVDVTLVAEDHSFSVHRVVLSAVSPYFHAIFLESQKPSMKLDNIRPHSLKYLVDYIYSGKVKVEREDLEDFLRDAKFWRLQGIIDIDENSDSNNSSSMPSNSIPNQRTDNEEIRDVVVKCERTECDDQNVTDDQNNINSNDFHNVEEEISMDANDAESFDDTFKDADWTPDSEESIAHDEEEEGVIEESYCTCECPCPDETNIDNEQSQSVCTNVTSRVDRSNDANKELDFPPSKRIRNDSNEFNIVADIQKSDKNSENLFYNGYKFLKGQTSKAGSTFWRCTCSSHRKCKAIVHTKKIDGVMMMKVIRPEHTHPPLGFSDFNIRADIRKNDRNFEYLYHDGYKFTINSVWKSSTYWICTMQFVARCKARAVTRNVNGTIMGKLTVQEHSHKRKAN